MKLHHHKANFSQAKIVILLEILILFTPIISSAQTVSGSSVLPQFVFGGGWYTALYFTNLSGAAVSFPVYFYSDTGTPLTVPSIAGPFTTVTVSAFGTAVLEAKNTGALNQGYATFSLPAGVGGYGVFRQSVAGVSDQEAVVPFSSSSATTGTITFDNTNLTTAVALVNSGSATAAIAVTVQDLFGNTIGTSTLALLPHAHTATVLNGFPGLSGISTAQGSAKFTASTGNVAVLGLRFNGSAFTSIPPTTDNFNVNAFKSGNYVGPNKQYLITITGPGIFQGGSTAWTLTTSAGANNNTYPSRATFYVGPLESNPFADRIKKAGITSTVWSYGTGSTDVIPTDCWNGNAILGFSQIGNTISVACFNKGIGTLTDTAIPGEQVVYTLVP